MDTILLMETISLIPDPATVLADTTMLWQTIVSCLVVFFALIIVFDCRWKNKTMWSVSFGSLALVSLLMPISLAPETKPWIAYAIPTHHAELNAKRITETPAPPYPTCRLRTGDIFHIIGSESIFGPSFSYITAETSGPESCPTWVPLRVSTKDAILLLKDTKEREPERDDPLQTERHDRISTLKQTIALLRTESVER